MAEPPADQPPQSSVADVWKRLKHHKVLQWTLAYAAAAYTLLHATQMVAESFDWPHLLLRVVALLLILGMPIVVLLAWYHGHKAQHRFSTATRGRLLLADLRQLRKSGAPGQLGPELWCYSGT